MELKLRKVNINIIRAGFLQGFFSCNSLEKTFHFSQESCKHLARYILIWKVLARNDASARNLQEILILQETCDILKRKQERLFLLTCIILQYMLKQPISTDYTCHELFDKAIEDDFFLTSFQETLIKKVT